MDPKDLSFTEEELEDELLGDDEETDDTEYDLDFEDELLEEGGF